jgi:flavorubredoxin
MKTQLKAGIDWVGYVDWTVRDFHGYTTDRGSSYNAYLIRDEKTVLVDTVKAPYVGRLLEHVRAFVDPARIDYVVCNHAEPDHSGGLPAVMAACTRAELVCDSKCRDALARHYNTAGWTFKIVADGQTLPIGRRTLTFIETPMVHWPESMFTFVPEDKVLFSMDAFGQHYAASHRFDDEEPIEVVMEEAKKYYANIVMLYGQPISRVLDKARDLSIDVIAPSHGMIWRRNLGRVLSAYREWVAFKPRAKVVVLFDTMWNSTARMAEAIVEGASESGAAEVRLLNVRSSGITAVATEVLDAATLAVGSPTLNKTLMPEMAAALTYLKGLGPGGKAGLAFGSYGWAKGGAKDVEDYLRAMKVQILREPLQVQFVPGEAALEQCREAGRLLASKAVEMARAADAGRVE